jgi:MFS transporter, CP family, cyanate transporter
MPGFDPPAAAPLDRSGHSTWAVPLFIGGISLLAFNMRAAITSVPPLFPELSARQHLPPAALAALAATPVLCFALFAPVAAPASRRFGEERVLLAALGLLATGLAVRAALPHWLLFPGTVIAAGAIALMNILLPSLVKRRRPGQAGLLIGVYLLCLCSGGILGSLLAVPVFQASGGSVPLALGMWAFPAIVAAGVWLPQRRHRTTPAGPGTAPPGRPQSPKVFRHLLAWQVMAFMGLQSLTYYAALSWLPVLFRDRGAGAVSAGTLLAVMNVGNAVTALLMPVLAQRSRDQRLLTAATVAATAAGLAGVWLAPLATAAAWTFLLGMGQGAALGLGVYFTAARAPDPVSAASLSGFAQGAGYLVATTGPLAVGLLHAATGGWALPMAVLLVALAGELAAGWPAARNRMLPSGDSEHLLFR